MQESEDQRQKECKISDRKNARTGGEECNSRRNSDRKNARTGGKNVTAGETVTERMQDQLQKECKNRGGKMQEEEKQRQKECKNRGNSDRKNARTGRKKD